MSGTINTRTVQETALYFNSQLRPNVENPNNMEQLNTALANIGRSYGTASSNLQRNGQFDLTELNNQYNYSEASLNIMRANLALSSAQINSSSMGTSPGTGGGLSVIMTNPETGVNFNRPLTPTEAYNNLRGLLNTASSGINNVSDQTLKTNLQNQIQAAMSSLNASQIGRYGH